MPAKKGLPVHHVHDKLYTMRELTATALRKGLFGVLKQSAQTIPTRVRYLRGDSVVLSYRQYQHLLKRRKKAPKGLEPLVRGRIVGDLNERTEKGLLKYMGIR